MVEDVNCKHPNIESDKSPFGVWKKLKVCLDCHILVEHLNGVYMTYAQRCKLVPEKVARYGRRGYGM